MTTAEAIAILEDARDRSGAVLVQDADVWEALDQLAADGLDRSALRWYWDSAGTANAIGRTQNLNASLNRIRHLLGVGR